MQPRQACEPSLNAEPGCIKVVDTFRCSAALPMRVETRLPLGNAWTALYRARTLRRRAVARRALACSASDGTDGQQRWRAFVAVRAEVAGQARILPRQGIERRQVGQPRMRHADGPARSKCGFQGHSGADLVTLDADPVEQVDGRSVTRVAGRRRRRSPHAPGARKPGSTGQATCRRAACARAGNRSGCISPWRRRCR